MTVSASNSPVASFLSIASARMGEPQSTCNASACLPHFFDTSNHLSENAPHMQFKTFLDTRFRTAPSMTPHAEDVLRYTSCFVESNCWSCDWIFAYRSLNPWPRCP